jgi:hypothetical protein
MSGGVYFDGSGDHIVTASSSDLVIGTNDATIEFFVWSDNFSSVGTNFDMRKDHATSVMSNSNSSGQYRLYANSGYRITADTAVTAKTWNHIAFTRTSGVWRMYVNGLLQSTTYDDSSANYTGNIVYIGSERDTTTELTGYISNFRMVIGSVVYTGDSFAVPTSALTAVSNTKLLTCQNAAPTSITNGAYHFTTTSSRLTTDHADFNISSSTPFTIEYWYYFVSSSNSTPIFDLGIGNQFQTYLISGNQKVYSSPGGGYIIDLGSGASGGFQNGVWHHLALTGDGSGNIKAYLDGVQKGMGCYWRKSKT